MICLAGVMAALYVCLDFLAVSVSAPFGNNLKIRCDPHEIGSGHSYRSCILAYAPHDSQFPEQSRKTLICIMKEAHF